MPQLMDYVYFVIDAVLLITLIAVLAALLGKKLPKWDFSQLTKIEPRTTLALLVVLFSVLGVFLIGVIVILSANAVSPEASAAASDKVMTALLPLFGTWVGTVMAFYFTRDAQQSGADIANEGAARATGSTASAPVTTSMIPLSGSTYFVALADLPRQDALGAVNLSELITAFDADRGGGKKWNRAPVVDAQKHPVFCVHRSIVDQYISKVNTDPALAGRPQDLTLRGLYNDPVIQKVLNDSIAIVPETATLADAKSKLGSSPNCQDIFITPTGTRNEPVLGWITDDIIGQEGKV